MKNFPKWFWFCIIAFMVVSWVAIPISAILTNHAKYVAQTVVSIGLIAYPIFFAVMLVILFRKSKLDSNEKTWAFLFLIIPIFVYLPFWSIISQE